MDTKVLSDPELRRFASQIMFPFMGTSGQLKLKNSKVAVIGAGALGTAVLQQLSSLGIGHLTIFDYVIVDELSLQRQTLYGGNDLGKLKTIISKERLQLIFPLVSYEIINLQVNESNAKRILSGFDFIIDASNDLTTAKLVFLVCKEEKTPSSFTQISGLTGKVTTIDFSNSVSISPDNVFNLTSSNESGSWIISHQIAASFVCNQASRCIAGQLPMNPVIESFFDLTLDSVSIK